MKPTLDLNRPDVVILISPALLQHYARLLDTALNLMLEPDPHALEGGPRAAAHVQQVAHGLADVILASTSLTIGPHREIQVHMPKEVTSPCPRP